MIRTEIRRIARDGVLILALLLLLAVGALATEYGDWLAPTMEIFLLLYASFTGWGAFERERQEGAMEFMLALPVSRLKLLLQKLLPRLAGVLLVFGVYMAAGRLWHFPFYLEAGQFLLFYSAFFLISFSFSLSFRNFITAFIFTALLSVGGVLLVFFVDRTRPADEAYLLANLPLLVLPLLFVLRFRRFDMRPINRFNLRFLPLAGAAVAVIWVTLFFVTRIDWGCHFLTSGGDVIRSNCSMCRTSEWITPQGKSRRLAGCMHLLREWGGRYYFDRGRRLGGSFVKDLVVLDSRDGPVQVLYTLPPKWIFSQGFYSGAGVVSEDSWYLMLVDPSAGEVKILQIRSGKIREIPVSLAGVKATDLLLFYAQPEPRRFYLWAGDAIYEVSEVGPARVVCKLSAHQDQNAARPLAGVAWKNRLLTCGGGLLQLVELDSGRVVFREEGDIRLLPPFGPKSRVTALECRTALIRKGRSLLQMFDLEQDRPQDVSEPMHPYIYWSESDRLWIVDNTHGGSKLIIWELRAGVVAQKKVWMPNLAWFRDAIFPAGILLWNQREYEVYCFGD